jgi:hypothetical protein
MDVGGNKDTTPGEAGMRDTQPTLDQGGNKDTSPVDVLLIEDTAPPGPDLPVNEDTPIQCAYAGTFYNPGESFQPDQCNTCICLSIGDFACTNKVCAVDGG